MIEGFFYALPLLDHIDYAAFGLLLGLNLYFWRKSIPTRGCGVALLSALVFGLILPFWSASREAERGVSVNGPAESIELLYTFLLFIPYWFALVLQLLILAFKSRRTPPPQIIISEDILDADETQQSSKKESTN